MGPEVGRWGGGRLQPCCCSLGAPEESLSTAPQDEKPLWALGARSCPVSPEHFEESMGLAGREEAANIIHVPSHEAGLEEEASDPPN